MSAETPNRYDRQMRFAPLGETGQQQLAQGRALVCGCGALGSVIANTLVRAGVGFVRIVDRDFLELNNLQRQVLYDEQDVADGLPKAVAAANKLRRINSAVTIEPIVADVTHRNIAALADDVDVIVDGTDNFAVRFLLNDYAVKHGKPWIYGGSIGAEGQTMTILPGETPCLACLVPVAPPPGTTPTCDTAGILGPIVGVIASIEANEALKILSGHREAVSRKLTVVELWDNRLRQVDVSRLRDQSDCRVCRHGQFDWLSGEHGGRAVRPQCRAAQPTSRGGRVVARHVGRAARRRGPHLSQRVLVAIVRRRLRADCVPRWADNRQRHRRLGHGPHTACTLHR
jgi:adenylyltransferase/sulfurtransferase